MNTRTEKIDQILDEVADFLDVYFDDYGYESTLEKYEAILDRIDFKKMNKKDKKYIREGIKEIKERISRVEKIIGKIKIKEK